LRIQPALSRVQGAYSPISIGLRNRLAKLRRISSSPSKFGNFENVSAPTQST
jgi:hypothetical protein